MKNNYCDISASCEIVNKLKETLDEIRKIAQGVRNYLQVPSPKDVRYEMDVILQKISECEVQGCTK